MSITTITEQPIPTPENTRIFDISIPSTFGLVKITTTVTSDNTTVKKWIANLCAYNLNQYHNRQLIVGVTIQSAPLGSHMAATLQLSTGNVCLIYQLSHSSLDNSDGLRLFLINSGITFVTLNHMTDILLRLAPHNFSMLTYMPMDVRGRTPCPGGTSLDGYSVARIANEVLGLFVEEIDLKESFSNWEAIELNLDQIKHATIDCYVAYEVGVLINASMFNPYVNRQVPVPSSSSLS